MTTRKPRFPMSNPKYAYVYVAQFKDRCTLIRKTNGRFSHAIKLRFLVETPKHGLDQVVITRFAKTEAQVNKTALHMKRAMSNYGKVVEGSVDLESVAVFPLCPLSHGNILVAYPTLGTPPLRLGKCD